MAQSNPTNKNIPDDHKYKRLLVMNLVLDDSSMFKRGKISVYLNISFGEDSQIVKFLLRKDGCIRFGIRRGELILKLKEGKMPLDQREFKGELPAFIDLKKQEIHKTQAITKIKASVSNDHLGLKADDSSVDTREIGERFNRRALQVTTTGEDKQPIWTFKSRGKEILEGGRFNEKLGVVQMLSNPFSLEAVFKINCEFIWQDLYITAQEGVWKEATTERDKKRKTTAERAILKRCVKPKIEDYLSRVVRHYDR